MALKLHGIDDITIKKMGRWSSLTFTMYIHTQIAHLSAGISSAMSTPLLRNLRFLFKSFDKSEQYTLATKQSFGFFDDITNENWKILRSIASSRQKHVIPNDEKTFFVGKEKKKAEGQRVPLAWFQSHYEPDFSCMFRKRVGGNGLGDGPKWVCDPHRIIQQANKRKKKNNKIPGCLIYSIGSCGDFSFEISMQKMLGVETCEVHTFDIDDYSNKVPKNMNIFFHHWGIDSKTWQNEKGKSFKTIKETMQELNHFEMEAVDIFKIDCEGCEHSTYMEWLDESHPALHQVLVEIHGKSAKEMSSLLDSFLSAGYVMFSKEHNIQYPNLPISEFSFLKLSKEFRITDEKDEGHFQFYE
ncbi:hypothetical protein CTEN210_06943 [Chaetoceros tenuissimus]|uniref:Methyltransferase domain-containing protein n=1 Tax=Chaetoceros tenuissimus TaxID=426638 RepID=A0AAD3CR11_9STRA|nr:hypothetical protein CTEN210_06943 [Chaetoceros tenuissimus]